MLERAVVLGTNPIHCCQKIYKTQKSKNGGAATCRFSVRLKRTPRAVRKRAARVQGAHTLLVFAEPLIRSAPDQMTGASRGERPSRRHKNKQGVEHCESPCTQVAAGGELTEQNRTQKPVALGNRKRNRYSNTLLEGYCVIPMPSFRRNGLTRSLALRASQPRNEILPRSAGTRPRGAGPATGNVSASIS